jgi:hypothetical protein
VAVLELKDDGLFLFLFHTCVYSKFLTAGVLYLHNQSKISYASNKVSICVQPCPREHHVHMDHLRPNPDLTAGTLALPQSQMGNDNPPPSHLSPTPWPSRVCGL